MSKYNTYVVLREKITDLFAALQVYGETHIDKPAKRQLAKIAKLAREVEKTAISLKEEE